MRPPVARPKPSLRGLALVRGSGSPVFRGGRAIRARRGPKACCTAVWHPVKGSLTHLHGSIGRWTEPPDSF